MRLLAPLLLAVVLAADAGAASAFTFVTVPAAEQTLRATHGFRVALAGDGWYVGEPAYASSGVPFTSDGSTAYTCPMAASGHDQGTRTAAIIDEHGNTLLTLKGKGIDRELAALLADADRVVPDARAQAAALLAKAEQAKARDARQLKRLRPALEQLAELKGWPEAERARALLHRAADGG